MTTEDAHYLLRLVAEQEERAQQIRNVVVNYMIRQETRERDVLPFPPQLRVECCGEQGQCAGCPEREPA